MNCVLHKNLPLQFFCQTCLDPICAQCIKSNPHSNQFHQILTLKEAVDIRKQSFEDYVENHINPLREQMRLKLQEIKFVEGVEVEKRNIIMKDILLEFEAIDQRVKEKAEKNTLQYQTQIKYYQAYLNSLDDLAYTFEKTASDPYNLLILYQDFTNQLKNLEVKEINQRIDEFQFGDTFNSLGVSESNKIPQNQKANPKEVALRRLENDLNLPRQIMKTLQSVAILGSLRQRNELLNALIAKTCENYQKEEKKCKQNSDARYKKRLHTFNNANQSIIKLNACKSCAVCGVSFTIEAANDQCIQNKSIKITLHEKYLHVNIPHQFRGTKRHYWTDSSMSSRNVPDMKAYVRLRPAHKKAFMNSLKDLHVVQCCFRKYQIENAKIDIKAKKVTINSFMSVFEKADKEKKGVLSKITFKYLLTKTFEMNPFHGDILTELLSYNWISIQEKKPLEEGMEPAEEKKLPQNLSPLEWVNYRLLKDLIYNPLFPYEQWQKIEQQNDKSKPFAPKSQSRESWPYGGKW